MYNLRANGVSPVTVSLISCMIAPLLLHRSACMPHHETLVAVDLQLLPIPTQAHQV